MMSNNLLLAYMMLLAVSSCGHARIVTQHNVAGHTADIVENVAPVEQTDTIRFPVAENTIYVVKKDYDLNGRTYIIPKGVTLKIKKGVIKNGTLVGQDTKIEGILPVFDKVTIKGDWIVPDISTKMFKDLGYDNSLRDVMALSNDKIANNVTIEKGVYYVKLLRNDEAGIIVESNTTVYLEGEIHLIPNKHSNYSIVKLKGHDCSIVGTGMIIGDKYSHTGTIGEWGMGVEFSKAINASVSGITIRDCWGDCIYVGEESKIVKIDNCKLDNGRRQGISITSADSVWIRDCVISNVSGTPPQYAIDVQPNADQKVSNVYVSNVQAIDCVGGFVVSGIGKNALIQSIVFSNCLVKGSSAIHPMLMYKANNIIIEGSEVQSTSKTALLVEEVVSLKAHNNTFKAKGNKHVVLLKSKKTEIEDNNYIINR